LCLLTDIQRELFLYDRVLFTSSPGQNDVHLAPIPESYTPDDFPDTLSDQNSLKAWQNLFKARRDWANDVLGECKSMCGTAEEFMSQRAIVDQGLRIASLNHDGHMKTLEQRNKEARDWLNDISKDVSVNAEALEEDLSRLLDVPAIPAFGRFFRAKDEASGSKQARKTSEATTLATFVDRNAAKSAVTKSRVILERYKTRVDGFEKSVKNIAAQFEELKRGMEVAQTRSLSDDRDEPRKLVNEVEAVAAKVSSDCENILSLRNEPKSLAQGSRIALLHTRNFLPALREYAGEMSDVVRHAVEQKNAAIVRAFDTLQMIANIESELARLNKGISSLQLSDDDIAAFDNISLVSKIPLLYGSLLIEAVRRQEWVDKMRRDSSSLAEEIAGYQEEEHKRRKKWLRTMPDIMLDGVEGGVPGVEINLQGEDYTWPKVKRQDTEDYVKALHSIAGLTEAAESLNQMIRDLDKPTKQQVKRAKTFKNGSIHDAGFGKASLLLRGEDEARIFKEANAKLEEELRGHKSRIRKLEDLLHRQSQISRMSLPGASPSQNGLSQPQDLGITVEPAERPQSTMSPRPVEQLSRQPSVQGASRKFSANQTAEEKGITRKLLQLETELAAEKEGRSNLTKELENTKQEQQIAQQQIAEANSTKKDLLGNMEAQQREFADERRSLEDELAKYKVRVEETEDELYRVLGSRDNERTGAEKKMDQMLSEVEQLRNDNAERIRKHEEQAIAHREELEHRHRADDEQREMLTGLYSSLAPGAAVPKDFTDVLSELEAIVQRSEDQSKDLAQALALARSENENLQAGLESQRFKVSSLATKLESREADIMKAQEVLSAEKAKGASVAATLEEERGYLKDLREQFADGRTGSESLRRELAEEEAKVSKLSSLLAETKSHVNSLDVELIAMQSKYRNLQETARVATARLNARGQRAKEITQRLYSQNDRLYRLLEVLGFAVTHEEDTMSIQRASKIGSISSVLPDQSILLRGVSPAPAKRLLDDLSDLSSLLWMEKDTAEDEAVKFKEFVDIIDHFNLEIFGEAIAKRNRDIEHTARKWQREARAYRDKSRRFQSDAHEKIAYRGFKEGDLALFLPTRNQATRPWAAFNMNAPHYFLREQDTHRLANKEWLVARITKVEERIVDLSKTITSPTHVTDGRSITEASEGAEDDNPFDLSDGLRWYLLDAAEEKPGAPSTPGLGKSTVAAANVDVRGSIRMTKKTQGVEEASRTLSKSLDSRRSSSTSKKSGQLAAALGIRQPGSNEALRADSPDSTPGKHGGPGPSHLRSESQTSSLRQPGAQALGTASAAIAEDPNQEEVRKDLLWGP
jgi:autophagy-related protein 11